MSATDLSDNVIPRADIVKRGARIGAEIRNIKLSGDLPDQTIAAINELLLENKVVFFATRVISMTPSRNVLLFVSEVRHVIRRSVPLRGRRRLSSLTRSAPVAGPTYGTPMEPSSTATLRSRCCEAS